MLFDAHTHIQFAAFANDYKEVAARALKNNVWMINVGTQYDTSERALQVASQYENGVYATVGLHPIHTNRSYHDKEELGGSDEAKGFTSRGEIFDYAKYKTLAEHPRVVAIGECGLDYFRVDTKEAREKQETIFLKHIELAHEVKKPLMIHCRNAFGELIRMLKENSILLNHPPGVIHFMSGTKEDAKELYDLGFSFTFGGVITFARDYDEVIKLIPMERILSETDAPYVTPAPFRGQRNEPMYVAHVVKKLAEIKDVPEAEMEAQIFENAKRVFGI